MRARLHVAAGRFDAAAAWAEEHGVGVADEPEYLHEYEQLTVVRLRIAEHRAGENVDLDPVLSLLDRLHAAASATGRAGSVLEIGVLRALVHEAGGDPAAATAALGSALLEAPEPESYARLLLDEGAAVQTLLRHAAGGPRPLARHAGRLLGSAGSPVDAPLPDGPRLPDPLSHRELEVLRLLDSELTGPEIARNLYVSVNTLRTHTKRIFTKLDVGTRAAAVRRARDVGLL